MLDFLQTIFISIVAIGTTLVMFLGIGGEELPSIKEKEEIPAKITNIKDVVVEFDLEKIFSQIKIKIKTSASTYKKLEIKKISNGIEKEKDGYKNITQEIQNDELETQKSISLDTNQKEKEEIMFPQKPESQKTAEIAPLTQEISIIETTKPIIKLLQPALVNEKVRSAIVNIFCLTKSGGLFNPISGSGIVIDPRGVILTNAHVAQYFLLKDYPIPDYIECMIRTGSPARIAYRAELLFLPFSWIKENSTNLKLSNPKGTGEHDFAFLRITDSAKRNVLLPETFSFVEPSSSTNVIDSKPDVFIASYPAGFLGSVSLNRDLWITTSIAKVVEIFTFKLNPPLTRDLFAVSGTVSAQEGSSGGAVINFQDGKLLGLIVTRTEGDTTGTRTLRALTMEHINESLQFHTGNSLTQLLEGNIKSKAAEFNTTLAPQLTEVLVQVLEKK